MMKSLSLAFALLAASTSAFAPSQNGMARPTTLYISENSEPTADAAAPFAVEETAVESTIVVSASGDISPPGQLL